jgi:hypothetical protein
MAVQIKAPINLHLVLPGYSSRIPAGAISDKPNDNRFRQPSMQRDAVGHHLASDLQ